MNKKEAAILVGIAAMNFPNIQKTNLEGTARLWGMMLVDIPFNEAKDALSRVLIITRFWPTVVDIREAVKALRYDRGAEEEMTFDRAWRHVWDAINHSPIYDFETRSTGGFDWNPIVRRIVDKFGGLNIIAESTNASATLSQFREFFNLEIERQKRTEDTQTIERLKELNGGNLSLTNEGPKMSLETR